MGSVATVRIQKKETNQIKIQNKKRENHIPPFFFCAHQDPIVGFFPLFFDLCCVSRSIKWWRVYIKWALSPLHSQPKDFLSVAFMKVPPRHYRAVCVPQNNLIRLSLSIADGPERTSCIPSNVDWNDSRGVVYRRPSSGEETLYERLLLAKDSSFFIFLLSFLSLTAGRDRKPIYPHQNVPYFYFYCS